MASIMHGKHVDRTIPSILVSLLENASMSNHSSAMQVEFERPFASSAQLLRSLADGALIADGDGVVRQANFAAAELLGISADALLGMRVAELPGGAAFADTRD